MGLSESHLLKTVYVRLIDEGTAAWRPTQAEEVGQGLYRLLPTENYDPEDEVWEFPPGAVVRCEVRTLSDTRPRDCLVAIEESPDA